jgi:phosphate-selective porin OprO/OprP
VLISLRGAALLALLCPLLALATGSSSAQEAPTNPAALDTTAVAGEADAQQPPKARGLAKYNQFDLGFTTLRLGYGFLIDFATYAQDADAKQQVKAEPDVDLRDFRLLLKGKLKTERPISWSAGIMWDKGTEQWAFRQTGLLVGVPEISSEFFIGRTKEGYSQYKVMTGYDIWTVERSPFLDAFVPILGDGIKWMGSVDHHRVIWNLGYYADGLSEDQKFATYDHQVVGRLVFLPVVSEAKGELVHLGVMARDGKPDENVFQAKSKPEAYLAPNFVDTGKFPTDHGTTLGVEAYYRKKSVMLGAEYGWQTFDAPTVGNPKFHGGNLVVDWFITGETRGYNAASGYFKAVSPTRTVFEGGPGAVEAGVNLSYIDLDSGTLTGGKFWRLGPVLKWHLMDYLRIELAYGYGKLDRFDREGVTQFFQGRFLTAL